MKKFTIWFELFGKKMKTEVMANSEAQAKATIKEKIIFHKVEQQKDEFDFSQFFKGFGKK